MDINNLRRQLITEIDINKELRFGNMILDNDEHRQVVKRTLVMQTNEEIDLEILKAYLEAEKEYGDMEGTFRYQALQLKYEALTTVPSTIEKTMSPAQLYASGSPLWAYDDKALTIESLLPHLKDKPKTEESFNEALEMIHIFVTERMPLKSFEVVTMPELIGQ